MAEVTITNNSSTAVKDCTFAWHFTDGQIITGFWNADITQDGDLVSAFL